MPEPVAVCPTAPWVAVRGRVRRSAGSASAGGDEGRLAPAACAVALGHAHDATGAGALDGDGDRAAVRAGLDPLLHDRADGVEDAARRHRQRVEALVDGDLDL